MDPHEETRSIRALRLSPIKDVEKSIAQRRVVPTRPPMSYRDPGEGRPFGIERKPRRGWGWTHVLFLLGSLVLLGFLAYPILFPKAVVTVTPKEADLAFSSTTRFSASKDGSSGVTYSLSPVVISDTVTVPATQKKQVEAKARGIITIRNLATATSQRLIKNTRFESKDGHIYRIRESVVVPGSTGTGDAKEPGTFDVEMFADEAGPGYNMSSGTFTIPGLKDKADLFSGITATVKTPIAGGSTGTRFVIDEKARADALAKLDKGILARAEAKAKESLTNATTTLTGARAFVYRDLPDVEEGTNVILGREITYAQMLFPEAELAEYLRSTSSSAQNTPDTPARLSNKDAVTVTIESKKTGIDMFGDKELSFSLAGTPHLVWGIDAEALARALDGAKRADINDILAKIPSVAKGTTVDIMPFWNNTVPRASRIQVHVVDAKK